MRRAIGLLAAVAIAVPLASASPARSDDRPTLAWAPCVGVPSLPDDAAECGRLEVPMDWASPDGRTFSLAVARYRSTGTPEERIGSLFLNPGGPGGSGLDVLHATWDRLPSTVRARFDLVSWDPRGVGLTTPAPVACAAPPSTATVVPRTGPVSLVAAGARAQRIVGPPLAACESANARIAAHLGTRQVVEDLDALRSAVGDPTLTYWGISYGTEIGYAYAVAHPDRVRAILLDSPMDPSPQTAERALDGAIAMDDAYRMFARFHPESTALFTRVLHRLAEHPVRLPEGQVLDRWSATFLVQFLSSWQSTYPDIVWLIHQMQAAVSGRGAARSEARANIAGIMTEFDASFEGPGWWVASAIACSDTAARPTVDDLLPSAQRARRTVSTFAAVQVITSGAACSSLTAEPDPVPTLTAGAGPRVPVLVIGSTHDGRTNGDWVARMRDAFPGARSITYRGGQHGLYLAVGSTCVDAPTTAFLLAGRLPVADSICPSTYAAIDILD